jgi:hypothetical protein
MNQGAAAVEPTGKVERPQLEKKTERDKGEPALKEQRVPAGDVRTDRLAAIQAAATRQAVVLDQRSPSSLPPAQQALQYRSRTNTIQTLIEERADTLRINLYPDVPIDANALRNARAERIGEDSLIITVEGQQIGFRLPPELRQTRKTK